MALVSEKGEVALQRILDWSYGGVPVLPASTLVALCGLIWSMILVVPAVGYDKDFSLLVFYAALDASVILVGGAGYVWRVDNMRAYALLGATTGVLAVASTAVLIRISGYASVLSHPGVGGWICISLGFVFLAVVSFLSGGPVGYSVKIAVENRAAIGDKAQTFLNAREQTNRDRLIVGAILLILGLTLTKLFGM